MVEKSYMKVKFCMKGNWATDIYACCFLLQLKKITAKMLQIIQAKYRDVVKVYQLIKCNCYPFPRRWVIKRS